MNKNQQQEILPYEFENQVYKCSSTIQVSRDDFSLLQLKQINALLYIIKNNLYFEPFDLKFDYIHNKRYKNLFSQIKYAIPLSTFKKHSYFTSRNNQNFLDSLEDLMNKKVRFSIFGKDGNAKIASQLVFFLGVTGKSENFHEFLDDQGDGYVYITPCHFLDDMSQKIGAYIPVHGKFKSKYSYGLYELILDYYKKGKLYLGKRNVKDIAEIIGGLKYYNERGYSRFKTKCLDLAINEINEKTELFVYLTKEEKVGNQTFIELEISQENLSIELTDEQFINMFLYKIKKFKKGKLKINELFLLNSSGNFISLEEFKNKNKDYKEYLQKNYLTGTNLSRAKEHIFTKHEKRLREERTRHNYKILFSNILKEINTDYSQIILFDDTTKDTQNILIQNPKSIEEDLILDIKGLNHFSYLYRKSQDKNFKLLNQKTNEIYPILKLDFLDYKNMKLELGEVR